MIGRRRVPAPPERISPLRAPCEAATLLSCDKSGATGRLHPQLQRRRALERTLRSLARADAAGRRGGGRQRLQRRLRRARPRSSSRRSRLLELGENLGFGRAINRAVAQRPADPLILLNNDAECRAALRRGAARRARRGRRDRSPGCCCRKRAPDPDRLGRRRRRPHADGIRLPPWRAGRGCADGRGARSGRPAAPRSTDRAPSRRSAASTSGSSSTTRTSTWRCG